MARKSRDKGARGESEVAALFRVAGFKADRTPNSGGLHIKGDLVGDVPLHVEVKRAERLKIPEWLEQARTEAPAGVTPLLAFRRNREGWYGVIPLEALIALLAVARLVELPETDYVPPATLMRDAVAEHEARKVAG